MKGSILTYLLFFGLAFTHEVKSQEVDTSIMIVDAIDPNVIFDQQSAPLKGEKAFRRDVNSSFTIPKAVINSGRSGKIEAAFLVDTAGVITDVVILQDIGSGSGEALVRAISKAGKRHKWVPAVVDGKKVKVRHTIPVTVNLNSQSRTQSNQSSIRNMSGNF
ncbi:MAG: energy transducer TonB [Sphingobacterium hotanense]